VSSVLSPSDQEDIINGLQGVIDTFLRPIYVYQEPEQLVVITSQNYNPIDGYNQNNLGVQNLANFSIISGRVLYDKQQEWAYVRPYVGRGPNEGQIKIKDQTTRSVRIKVDVSGYALFSTAKQIKLDGFAFNIESQPRPHGLFTPTSWTFYLVRSM
jgi:hypothetical protein